MHRPPFGRQNCRSDSNQPEITQIRNCKYRDTGPLMQPCVPACTVSILAMSWFKNSASFPIVRKFFYDNFVAFASDLISDQFRRYDCPDISSTFDSPEIRRNKH